MLNSTYAKAFFLLEIEGPTHTVRLTSTPYNITSDGKVFSASPAIIELEPPSLSDNLDRAPYSVRIGDANGVVEAKLRGAQGAPFRVSMGFIDPDTNLPVVDDLLALYIGFFDTQTREYSDGAVSLVVQGSSPYGALEASNTFTTSKSSQRARDPLDSSMDFISLHFAEEVAIQWGK